MEKSSYRRKVFQKGQIVIPVTLRKKYRIEVGDQVEVLPQPEGILLKPTPLKTHRPKKTDVLFGAFKKRAAGRRRLTKKTIGKITERAFTEGWDK